MKNRFFPYGWGKTVLASIIISTNLGFAPESKIPFVVTDRLLDAIKRVESGGNSKAVSPKGAKGAYQILESTWKEHSNGVSYDKVFDEVESRKVCKTYLVWIDRYLTKKMNRDATRDEVIICYNGGIGRFAKVKFDMTQMPAESRQYVVKINKQITAAGGK